MQRAGYITYHFVEKFGVYNYSLIISLIKVKDNNDIIVIA